MQRFFMIITIFQTLLYSAYNPFFSDEKPPVQKKEDVKVIIKKESAPKMENAKIKYFGFIESSKGRFALVNFEKQNIVIKKDDSLYAGENFFKVIKITSNYILLNDRYKRAQTVYFSSEMKDK